jgi:hypothetical protein
MWRIEALELKNIWRIVSFVDTSSSTINEDMEG